ncbi:hypothetical protein LP085_01545 [Achromobacter sp. MY14]|nr:hypothetical protein [Achromobacter sp. MY14]
MWVIFVHGVGDHCVGYALDAQSGVLNANAMTYMRLRSLDMQPPTTRHIDVSVFSHGGPTDSRSKVDYTVGHYQLHLTDSGQEGGKDYRVNAVEIRWSALTQWLKSNQLAYDSPSATPKAGERQSCTEGPDDDIQEGARPPDRARINQVIKETVLDRELADAMLYAGSYGKTIERGVAEAICHALIVTPDEQSCRWESVAQLPQSDRFYVVTHSLGSRIVYDMLLDLTGTERAKTSAFSKEEVDAARDGVRTMVAHMPAFYMLANQLPMIGLADVPPGARSHHGPSPFGVPPSAATANTQASPEGQHAILAQPSPELLYWNPFYAFGQMRQQALAEAHQRSLQSVPTLDIVAFHDTNDLLTWHLPPWYQSAGSSDGIGIHFTNVFVRNARDWLHVFASPVKAHTGYFSNKAVWDVVRCGVSEGKIMPCD